MIFNAVIAIWVTAAMTLGFFMPQAAGLNTSNIMYFHVPMAISMEVAFLMAAWHGVRYLQTRRMEHDAQSVAFAEVGLAFGIIATITGAIWAKLNWGAYWSWDPQQIGIVAVLLTYFALFALRGATEDDEKTRSAWAVYAIFGIVAAIFWTFIFRRLPQLATLHPPAVLIDSSPIFKVALWTNVAGFAMVMIKAALLRGRVQVAQEKLKENAYVD